MKYEIVYTKNEELWKMEKIAKSHGYKKTEDCYWVQIFEDTNGNHIVMTREDGELLSNPCDRLEAMLRETEMKEFKENVVNKMIEKSQDMRIVSLRETAAELGINHISAQDTRDIAQQLRKVEGYHLVQMMNTPNDSLFCSLCLVENGVEFDDVRSYDDKAARLIEESTPRH